MAQKPTATTATSTNGPETIYLGDEVTLHDTKRGIVRFIGPMEGKNTPIFYGVELKSGTGKNDGTSNGQNFFKCATDKGIFTTKMKISKAKATAESKQFPHITAGTRVNVVNKSQGVVRYIGHVSFGEDIWIGVELDEPNGDHDGTVDKRWYFKCNDKHGVFVRADAIEVIAVEKKKPAAGDSAKKTSGTTSTTGTTNAKKPAGAKSPAKSAAKTSTNPALKNKTSVGGDAKSKTTATTKPTASIGKTKEADKNKNVAPKSKSPAKKTTTTAQKTPSKSPAKKTTTTTSAKNGPAKNGATKEKEKEKEKENEHEKEQEKEKEEIKVGDKVLIKPDKKGQVKYVGQASNIGPGIWYGVRLTEKRGQCDGEYRGHEFFQCPEGYGVYVQDTLIVRKLTGEESNDFDFMDEEKSIEAMKEARLEEVRKERVKLQAITQKFKELDTDGNKALSREEFSKLAVELLQCDPRSARELFMNVDTNGSGEISFAEFEKWLSTGNTEIVNALVEEQKEAGVEAPTQESAAASSPKSSETNPTSEASPADKTDTEANTTVTTDEVVANADAVDKTAANDSVEVEDAPVDEAEAPQENHASENSTENVNENANENSQEDAKENINDNTNENTTENTDENTDEHANENTNEDANENTNENVEEKAEDHQSNPENEPATEETTNETTSNYTSEPETEETGNHDNSANTENNDNNAASVSNDNNSNENPQ